MRSYVDTSGTLAQGSSSYTVTATDSTGTSAASAATAVVYDTVAPPVPTTLAAATPTNQKPALGWVSGGNDATSGFVNYQVFRGTTLVGTPTGTTLTDTGLVSSGSQSYTVRAVDAAGNISVASTAKAVMYDTLQPSAPVLNAPAATNGSTTLTWTASSDTGGSTLTGYLVYRDGVLIGAPTPATALTFTDTGAMSAGSYVYTVVAHDGAGNNSLASNAKTVVYDVTLPGTPSRASAPSPTSAKPTLLWTTTTDSGGSGVARYEVYRTPPGGVATLAGTTVVGSFTDAAVTQSGTYAYTVRAVDGAGNAGASSSSVNVTYDNTAPTVPTALNGTTPTASPPVLTWAASTDALSGVDHYDVLRGGTKINSSPLTTLTYTDTSPIAASQTYAVRAVDAAGNMSVASSAKVIVYDPNPPSAPSLSAPVATAVDPALSWTASTDPAGGSSLAGYRVYRDGTLIATTSSISYTDSDSAVVPGTYVYSVVAFDGAGNTTSSAQKTVIVDTSPPAAPGSVAAVSPTNAKPVISWAAASDGGGPSASGIVRYDVYRGAVLAGSSTSTSFTDAGATANSTISYTVVAVDAAANRSPASTAVAVVYDTSAPPTPTNIGGATPTASAPVVTWTSGGADNLAGLAYYAVFRGSTQVGTTSALSFTDSLLATAGSPVVHGQGRRSGGQHERGHERALDHVRPDATRAAGKAGDSEPDTRAGADLGGRDGRRRLEHRPLRRLPDACRRFAGGRGHGHGHDVHRHRRERRRRLLLRHRRRGRRRQPERPLGSDGGVRRHHASRCAHGPDRTGHPDREQAIALLDPVERQRRVGNRPVRRLPRRRTGGRLDGNDVPRHDPRDERQLLVHGQGRRRGRQPERRLEPADGDLGLDGPARPGQPDGNVAHLGRARAQLAERWRCRRLRSLRSVPGLDARLLRTRHELHRRSADPSRRERQPLLHRQVGRRARQLVICLDAEGRALRHHRHQAASRRSTGRRRSCIRCSPGPPRPTPAAPTSPATACTATERRSRRPRRSRSPTPPSPSTAATPTSSRDRRRGQPRPPSRTRTIQVDQTPPPAPTHIVAVSPANVVTFSWDATADTGASASGVAGYRVYRNGSPLPSTTVPAAYTDTTVSLEGTWVYTIAAIDAAGNEGPQSAPVSILYDRTPPPPPSGLSVPAVTQVQPTLTWVAGGADALSGFAFFQVLRDGNVVGSTTSPTFTDSGLTAEREPRLRRAKRRRRRERERGHPDPA